MVPACALSCAGRKREVIAEESEGQHAERLRVWALALVGVAIA
jgi:hypothetical protein